MQWGSRIITCLGTLMSLRGSLGQTWRMGRSRQPQSFCPVCVGSDVALLQCSERRADAVLSIIDATEEGPPNESSEAAVTV